MTTEQFDREKKYQAALAVARAMLKNGIITEDDYARVAEIMREKFCPLIGAYKY